MTSISAWALLHFLSLTVESQPAKEILFTTLYIAIILTPINFFFFVCSFTTQKNTQALVDLLNFYT